MKKLLFGLLTVSLLLSTGILTAFAAGGSQTLDTLGDKNIDVHAAYNDGMDTPTVYSVDITWGAMEFTYSKSGSNAWNPANHTFEENTTAIWSASGNTIVITNHSNAAVSAALSYASDAAYNTVTGSFSKATISLPSAAQGESLNDKTKAPKDTSELTLAGTLPESAAAMSKIGSITVTLS